MVGLVSNGDVVKATLWKSCHSRRMLLKNLIDGAIKANKSVSDLA